MNENQDLWDLCQLNLLEEKIDSSLLTDSEKAVSKKFVDWKRRQAMSRLLSTELLTGAETTGEPK